MYVFSPLSVYLSVCLSQGQNLFRVVLPERLRAATRLARRCCFFLPLPWPDGWMGGQAEYDTVQDHQGEVASFKGGGLASWLAA